MGVFPFGTNMSGLDLRGAKFGTAGLRGRSFRTSVWNHCNLCEADGSHGEFGEDDFFEVFANGARFDQAYLGRARFAGAHLRGAAFHFAFAADVDFSGSDLNGAILWGSWLEGARFTDANFAKADFSRTNCKDAVGLPESIRRGILAPESVRRKHPGQILEHEAE
jgi:uncharacterized protein YjbI with pentapeptide repeats